MKYKNERMHKEFEDFCKYRLGIKINDNFMRISQHLDMDNAICLGSRQSGYSTIKIAKVVYTILQSDKSFILTNHSVSTNKLDKMLLLHFLNKCGVPSKTVNENTVVIGDGETRGKNKQIIKFVSQRSLIDLLYNLSIIGDLDYMLYADDIDYETASQLASFKRSVDVNDKLFVNIKAFKKFGYYDSVFLAIIEKDLKSVFYNNSLIHTDLDKQRIEVIKSQIGDDLYKQEYKPKFNK